MRIQSSFVLGFWICLVIGVSLCHGSEVEVIGFGECADCALTNIKSNQAFLGLRVTIDCKAANGEFKRKGYGELDKDGKFKVSLPRSMTTKSGALKEECYAQLHSATSISSSLLSSSAPCPSLHSLEASKIVFKSLINGKQTFGTVGKLKFSPTTCVSATWWYHHPPLPKWPPMKGFGHHYPFPPKVYPPIIYKKPQPPPTPVYEPPTTPIDPKPEPPSVPIYKPEPKPKPEPSPSPVPVYKPEPKPEPKKKPCPSPAPVYKPKPKPKPKPSPTPVPVYKPEPEPKPSPTPVPIYKPKPDPEPKPSPSPVPIYKPTPTPTPIPIYKNPCPPLPKISLPPYKHFPHHPYFPPLPPHHP